MQQKLAELPGISPMPSSANFLLIRAAQSLVPLREALEVRHRILLRDCRSFEGLGENWLRIGLQSRHGNRRSPRHCPRRLPSRRHRRPCRLGLSRPRWSTPRLVTAATAATVLFQRSSAATAVTAAAAATPAAIFAAIADAAERGGV